MLDNIMGHIPAYIDDRMTFDIVLSDQLHWTYYNLAAANTISSWYNYDNHRAYAATRIDDVPEQHRDKLIQWDGTRTDTSMFMMPILTQPVNRVVNTTKTFKLAVKPCFSGNIFKIWWDWKNDQDNVSTYTQSSLLSDFQHEYDEYGFYTIKFSSNLLSIGLNSSDNGQTAGIQRISSRSNNLNAFGIMSQSRNIESIHLSHVSAMNNVWYDCYNLTSISLPDLKDFRAYAGMNCMYFLENIYAPKVEVFNNETGAEFKGDISLKEAFFPALTATNSTGGFNFQTCISLTSVYMPKLIKANKQEFQGCINLKKTNFTSLSAVPNSMFAICMSLEQIELPSVKSIGTSAFSNCINLKEIDLSRAEQVPSLASIDAFSGLPFDYKVYVKPELLDSYRIASNWSDANVIEHVTTK